LQLSYKQINGIALMASDAVYVLGFQAKPTKLSPEYGSVDSALIEIWVHSPTREQAESNAQSYLMDCGWSVIELLDAEEMLTKDILDYSKDTQSNLSKALRKGVHSLFLGNSLDPEASNSVEIRPLKKPFFSNDSKH